MSWSCYTTTDPHAPPDWKPFACQNGHRWIWTSSYMQTEPEPNQRCECGAFAWREFCDYRARPTVTMK